MITKYACLQNINVYITPDFVIKRWHAGIGSFQ